VKLAGTVACVMRHLDPPTLPPPNGYTHVVDVTGGRTIYISGQVALDRTGAVVGDGDFAAQTHQVFANLEAALAAAEATFADIAKITVFVTDLAQLDAFRKIRNDYFGARVPASSLVKVVQLFRPELLIEIEAIAVVR
jgi:reactive intermediate/imine deaminase